jgi:hypothetical protein
MYILTNDQMLYDAQQQFYMRQHQQRQQSTYYYNTGMITI